MPKHTKAEKAKNRRLKEATKPVKPMKRKSGTRRKK